MLQRAVIFESSRAPCLSRALVAHRATREASVVTECVPTERGQRPELGPSAPAKASRTPLVPEPRQQNSLILRRLRVSI